MAPGSRDLSGHFCPNCGAPLTADEGRACKFCGENLMPYFAPQVARAKERGTARGLLLAGIGCVSIGALGVVALIAVGIIAALHQGGNSENDYSCSPGPCAIATDISMRVNKITFGSIPTTAAGTHHASGFVRFLIQVEASAGAGANVRSTDFGLVDRQGRRVPVATGFSPCQAWTEIDAPGSGSNIPSICFAVGDTDITHYRMTWARLKPGQSIRLYMPTS